MKKREKRFLTATVVLVGLLLLCLFIYGVNERILHHTEESLEKIKDLAPKPEEGDVEVTAPAGTGAVTEKAGMAGSANLLGNAMNPGALNIYQGENAEPPKPGERLKALGKNLPETAECEVERILQYPELPTGCESVSLTMVLNYYGFDLDKTDIADAYLVYDAESFLDGYMGDPYTETGAGIYPPGLTETANDFLKSKKSDMTAYNLLGTDFEDLYVYVAAGYPVVLWTTISYESPIFEDSAVEYRGEEYSWFSDEHCVVLTGYDLDEGIVRLADPLAGEEEVDIDTIEAIYDEIGQPAMVIY